MLAHIRRRRGDPVSVLTHIRRDEAIRSLPMLLASGVLIGLMTTAMLIDRLALSPFPVWAPWLPLMVYLGHARERRANPLDLALPVSARRLWIAKGLALCLGGATVLAFGFGILALYARIFDVPGAGPRMIDAALRLGVGLVIAVALSQCHRPALAQLSLTLGRGALLVLELLAVSLLVLRLEVGWMVALVALALVLVLRTWRSLPAAFVLEPMTVAEPPDLDPQVRWAAAPPGGWGTRRRRFALPVCLLQYQSVGVVVSFIFLLIGGLLLSLSHSLVDLVFWWFCATFMVMQPIRRTMSQLVMFEPLPVSRRSFFAAMVLPAFGALVLGYGISLLHPAARTAADPGSSAIVLLLAAVLWLGLILLFLGVHHRLVAWVELGSLVALLVGIDLTLNTLTATGWLAPDALDVTADTFVEQLAAHLPGGRPALAFLAVLLLVGAYALAEARFRRFEVPPSRGDAEPVETIWDLLADKEGNLP